MTKSSVLNFQFNKYYLLNFDLMVFCTADHSLKCQTKLAFSFGNGAKYVFSPILMTGLEILSRNYVHCFPYKKNTFLLIIITLVLFVQSSKFNFCHTHNFCVLLIFVTKVPNSQNAIIKSMQKKKKTVYSSRIV